MEQAKQTPASTASALKVVEFTIGKTDIKVMKSIDPSALPKSLGVYLKEQDEKFSFPLHGCTVTVPALTSGNDHGLRYLRAIKSLTAQIFEQYEQDEVLTDTDIRKTLDGLGVKFTGYTKAAVLKGVNERIQNRVQKIGIIQQATAEVNKVLIEETNTIKQARKIMKESGLEASRAFLAGKSMNLLAN